MSVWGGPHSLRALDVIDSPQGLTLVVYSTKTLSGSKPTFLHILPAPCAQLCPVRAWRRYKNLVNPWPYGPAFVYNDNIPVTPRPIVALMRLALKRSGHPQADRVTMHSLRRGGAQCAAARGGTTDQLMSHGTWKSKSGLKPYITEDQRIIPQLIAESLA